MNESSPFTSSPTAQAWVPPKSLISHHAIRITLHSTTRMAEDGWHPKDTAAPGGENEGSGAESTDVIQYSADGDLLNYDDRILITYPEPPETGMANCVTNLLWFKDKPTSVEYFRNGLSHFRVCLDASAPIQAMTYAGEFGTMEGMLHLATLQNDTDDGVGRLRFSYDLTFTRTCIQHVDMRILIRRLRESEYRPDMEPHIPDMDKRIQATRDLISLRRLGSHPYPQKKSDPDICAGMALSELLEQLSDELGQDGDDTDKEDS